MKRPFRLGWRGTAATYLVLCLAIVWAGVSLEHVAKVEWIRHGITGTWIVAICAALVFGVLSTIEAVNEAIHHDYDCAPSDQ